MPATAPPHHASTRPACSPPYRGEKLARAKQLAHFFVPPHHVSSVALAERIHWNPVVGNPIEQSAEQQKLPPGLAKKLHHGGGSYS